MRLQLSEKDDNFHKLERASLRHWILSSNSKFDSKLQLLVKTKNEQLRLFVTRRSESNNDIFLWEWNSEKEKSVLATVFNRFFKRNEENEIRIGAEESAVYLFQSLLQRATFHQNFFDITKALISDIRKFENSHYLLLELHQLSSNFGIKYANKPTSVHEYIWALIVVDAMILEFTPELGVPLILSLQLILDPMKAEVLITCL